MAIKDFQRLLNFCAYLVEGWEQWTDLLWPETILWVSLLALESCWNTFTSKQPQSLPLRSVFQILGRRIWWTQLVSGAHGDRLIPWERWAYLGNSYRQIGECGDEPGNSVAMRLGENEQLDKEKTGKDNTGERCQQIQKMGCWWMKQNSVMGERKNPAAFRGRTDEFYCTE